jgi:DNA-binding IclR family transcriptional regulator
MMLRELAQRVGISPAQAHRYLVSFLRLGVVAQDPLSGRRDEPGGFALQLGLARLARVDGVKLARIALAELRDRRARARSDRARSRSCVRYSLAW